MPPLDVPKHVRLNLQQPLHDKRLLEALQPVDRLHRQHVTLMQQISQLVEVARQPISLAIEPKLGRHLPAHKTPQPPAQRAVRYLLDLRERNCRSALPTPIRLHKLAPRTCLKQFELSLEFAPRALTCTIGPGVPLVMSTSDIRKRHPRPHVASVPVCLGRPQRSRLGHQRPPRRSSKNRMSVSPFPW
jgi:hypothetical protein